MWKEYVWKIRTVRTYLTQMEYVLKKGWFNHLTGIFGNLHTYILHLFPIGVCRLFSCHTSYFLHLCHIFYILLFILVNNDTLYHRITVHYNGWLVKSHVKSSFNWQACMKVCWWSKSCVLGSLQVESCRPPIPMGKGICMYVLTFTISSPVRWIVAFQHWYELLD